jgi:glycosyltransferase involved in cell wall biosynthesis
MFSPQASPRRPKVLLIVESCNPEWTSVPLVGYRFFEQINAIAEVTLVTHERNQKAIERLELPNEVVYIQESRHGSLYYRAIDRVSTWGNRTIWPLYHTLRYPLYHEFNLRVDKLFASRIAKGEFDIVHALTPMEPRYAFQIAQSCGDVPFVLGPVNGGVPYPEAFQATAKREFAQLNFLRALGRWLIPGYAASYRLASLVLAGSSYTRQMVRDLFDLPESRVALMYENGVPEVQLDIVQQRNAAIAQAGPDAPIKLLFVGRLVPYKGPDMLLEAIAKLPEAILQRVQLTIVGEGEMHAELEAMAQTLGIAEHVRLTGFVPPAETTAYYASSDLFCFPSVREYGGAVAMEAMAYGLPCIVVNNGGIGEYVVEGTGISIEPKSREFVVQTLAEAIECLTLDASLRQAMSQRAVEHAQNFTWQNKGQVLSQIYQQLLVARPVKAAVAKRPVTMPLGEMAVDMVTGDGLSRESLAKGNAN